MPKGMKGFQKGHVHSEETKTKIGNTNRRPIYFTCDYCGEESVTNLSTFNKKKRHFCSQRCYSKYRAYIMPTEEQSRYGTGLPIEERIKRAKARSTVNHAVRDGRLEREPCEISTCVEWPEAHHDDYDKPLEVRWLCFKHHREYHKHIYENHELLEIAETLLQ